MKMKIAITFLILALSSCSRRSTHHKHLHEAQIEFQYGKGQTAKRDTIRVVYWDYLLYFKDAITKKDTTIIGKDFTKYRILYDKKINY